VFGVGVWVGGFLGWVGLRDLVCSVQGERGVVGIWVSVVLT
jgi:hypothetical protein